MVINKYPNNHGTAFYIWHTSREGTQDDYSRLCFAKDGSLPPLEPGGEPQFGTSLQLKYYNCATASTTIPSGEYAECTLPAALTKVCLSVFDKQFMNPYVQGILGNWRQWRSYVFYGERRNSDNPATVTNIAIDGVIKDFVPFWTYNATKGKIELGQSTKWVWNSEIAQYNRKGAQLEDHDALNRYNTAIYGYQESLPIATVNNSRLRLSAFDGFEDYGYKDDPCEPFCKPAKRHFETGILESMLDETESHTGMYSFKLNNSSYDFAIPVSADNASQTPVIKIDISRRQLMIPLLT